MKLNEIPEEYKSRVDFACKVCRATFKAATGSDANCAWRRCSGRVCDYIEQVIKEKQNENS